jgi:hypothetical protein
MAKERKAYARYIYNRGLQTFWKGDAAKAGSQFRSVAIASDQFNSTKGIFQVYALEGIGKGIQNGKFAGSDDDPHVLFDKDIHGLEAAAKQFNELLEDAQRSGFQPISFMDMLEFEAKLQGSNSGTNGR